MSGHSRRKGANGERELCAILSAEFGQVIKRKLGQARDAGFDADIPGFNVECKRRMRVANLYEWMKQADTGNGKRPVVMLRADGKEWLAVVRLSDFCVLAREEIAK